MNNVTYNHITSNKGSSSTIMILLEVINIMIITKLKILMIILLLQLKGLQYKW